MKISTLFKDKAFFRDLFFLALPIMAQNLINASVNTLDTVMIGRLGTVAIAGVGLGNQVFFLYTMILFGICSGGTVFTAQYWGKRDIQGIRRTTGLCISLAAVAGIIFTLLCLFGSENILSFYSRDPQVIEVGAVYLRTLSPAFLPFAVSFAFMLILRSIEKVKLTLASTMVSLGINLTLNFILIFGLGPIPALGVAGAAIATVVSRTVELIILVSVSYARSYELAGTPKELFCFDASFLRRFFRIAFPVIVNELIWSLGVTMQNVIFARTDTSAIAAFNITNTVSMLTWVFFIGLGNGASVLVGKKIGAGDEAGARDSAARITLFAPLASIAFALLLVPLSWTLRMFFRVDQEVLDLTSRMLFILALTYPCRAFNMTMIIGVCRAGGDTVFSVVYDTLLMWTVSLPIAAAASFVFSAPVWVVYLCIVLEDPLKMILGIFRLRSGKWLHNVTV